MQGKGSSQQSCEGRVANLTSHVLVPLLPTMKPVGAEALSQTMLSPNRWQMLSAGLGARAKETHRQEANECQGMG